MAVSLLLCLGTSDMGSFCWQWEQHQFLMHQCFSLPFAFVFYFLAKRGNLSLTYRYAITNRFTGFELEFQCQSTSQVPVHLGTLIFFIEIVAAVVNICHISVYRYLFVSVGGCVLAVVTMGIYSVLLFVSALVFVLLLCSVDPGCIHTWAFGIQMLWQTFWHLLIQYGEYYLHEPVSIRYVYSDSTTTKRKGQKQQ